MDMRDMRPIVLQNGIEKTVLFAQRPPDYLSCPVCWTDQRPDRDRCYRCETRFVFDLSSEEREIG